MPFRVAAELQSTNRKTAKFSRNNLTCRFVCRAFFSRQIPVEHAHLMDVLYACTDQSSIALKVIRLSEELDLNTVAKMYTMALEVRARSPSSLQDFSNRCTFILFPSV